MFKTKVAHEKAAPEGASLAIGKLLEYSKNRSNLRVLELGVKRSDPDRSTMHRDWFPDASVFVGTDFEAGIDVDVVADLHELSRHFGEAAFDVILSFSVFEHVRYPWIAAEEISKVLAPDGLLFVQTHQSFPIHAYPHDYWRFTTDALEGVFCPGVGYEVLHSEYVFPCAISSDRDPYLSNYPSYLNVHLLARRSAEYTIPRGGVDWRRLYFQA